MRLLSLATCLFLALPSALGAPHPRLIKSPAQVGSIVPASKSSVDRLGLGFQRYLDGNYEEARKTFEPLLRAQILNRDYLLYFLAQSELLSNHAASARAHFEELSRLPSRFQNLARWRLADALFALDRGAEAKRAYEVALGHVVPEVEPTVALFRIAQILEKEEAAVSAAAYRRVFVEHPMHPLAERALERLRQLQPVSKIHATEHIARAKLLTQSRAWPRALEELAQIPRDEVQAVRDEADYWIGTTLFKMRREYAVAAEKLLSVWSRLPGEDRRAEALFHGARAKSRADLDDEAITGYHEVVSRFPRSHFAPEASFLIGWLEFNRARYAAAIPALEETLRRYGSSTFEDDARWYLGLSHWLRGDIKDALADFEKLAMHRGALSGGKGAYWKARALVLLGRKSEAQATYRALVNDYPFSYYALSARARLEELGAPLGPFGDAVRSNTVALGALDPSFEHDPIIARVDELLGAGLAVEAGIELRRHEAEFIRQHGASKSLPLLFDRYERAGHFQRIHQLGEAYGGPALRLDPWAAGQSAVRTYWERTYPRAYREFVERHGPSGENPPFYLYTIMQKESAYNPHDVSYADAIGLLQMIPPTSRRVAERIGRLYTDDVLYDPEGNIQFGAWYIGHLLRKFKGQIPVGAGSYNAGPKAMEKWLKRYGARSLDEFIELCPYAQTREYMKKVLDIYARYLYLYEKKDYLPDAKVDASYLKDDGIDY